MQGKGFVGMRSYIGKLSYVGVYSVPVSTINLPVEVHIYFILPMAMGNLYPLELLKESVYPIVNINFAPSLFNPQPPLALR